MPAIVAVTWLCVAWAQPSVAHAGLETSTSTGAVRVELITIGPGEPVETYWGHSALRIADKSDGSDSAYTLVGREAGVLGRMIGGDARADLLETPFTALLERWSREDRTITRRVIDLAPEASRSLARRVQTAARGARDEHAYDFFRANASTWIAGELDRATGGELARAGAAAMGGTYRSHTLRPLRAHALVYLAADLALTDVDRAITRYEASFLPEGLAALADATAIGGRRLVSDRYEAYRSVAFARDPSIRWAWPWTKLYIVLVLPLSLFAFFRPRAALVVFGAAAGALGSCLAILSIGASDDFLRANWNVAVLPPTHLIAAAWALSPSAMRVRFRGVLGVYLALHAAMLAIFVLLLVFGLVEAPCGPAIAAVLTIGVIIMGRMPDRSARRTTGGSLVR
jgi:hypothetical protein